MKQKPKKNPPKGFALVVTLSMMILLTVIAVGLLTLSTISIRAAGQNNSMSVARSNAKLALMIAIGDLQKAAGPDKAITATSDLTAANPQKPNLTGVWDSWDMDVKINSPDYSASKTRKSGNNLPGFKGWLVSDSNIDDTAEYDYPTSALSGNSVELVGKGSLGDNALDTEKVRAGRVPLTKDGKVTGNYAWHISDESIKARINTYRDTSGTQTLSERRSLLGGHRPDITVMKNRDQKALDFMPDDSMKYAEAVASTSKILDLDQVELYADSPTIKSFRNDVTPYSLGLLTNVREGGLKQDLTSVFELTTSGGTSTTGLPSAFANKRLYETGIFSQGSAVKGISDPYWSALAGYYNCYRELISAEGSPKLQKAIPREISILNITQPTEYSPAPVIAKVELLFSMIVRDKHGPHKGRAGDYELHMLYIPMFTIHNPYNVSLQFDKMKVGLEGVPVGFRFLVNGAAKSGITPLSNMFSSAQSKSFWMELANWPSATATNPTAPIVMKPGQSMVFGPYINASEPFGDDNASYFDYTGTKTGSVDQPLKSKLGFSGAHLGYNIDWLCGDILNVNKADKIAVEFKSTAPSIANPFRVTATLTNKGSTRGYGGMSFTYSGQTVLDKILPGTFRYPKTDGVVAQSMYVPNTQPAGSITVAKAFGLFSAYARTANGGVDNTGLRVSGAVPATAGAAGMPDGRLAGNPFLHNNAARAVILSDLNREKPATQSHELNLISLPGGVDDAFSIATDYRTNTLLNYKQVNGRSIKSGSYFDIPSGPLQAISDFRRSNALASPYLPAFVQPIGNSYASPLIDTKTTLQSDISSYVYMDHSFLANHLLYDRNYFSTLAPLGSTSASDGFTKFMKENRPLRTQLFQRYLPMGKTIDDAKSELFSGAKPTQTAYKIAAQYQMVKGAFNVNSTRVQAWKAMLSSMKGTSVLTLWAKTVNLAPSVNGQGSPIPSMTLHNGSDIKKPVSFANIDDAICNEWNGYREYTDSEIETLATKIVEQVRLRGPFQSMSEFVNRRLGDDSNLTRMGALQNAIDESQLNDETYADGRVTVRVNETDVSAPNLYGFKTPKAATGNPAAGAPGWLSQGDVLKVLEPAATVRSDTFVIRACGEAVDNTGNVTARAFAEAVVQRIPEYVNPADAPTSRVPNPNNPNGVDVDTPDITSAENIAFGRRFVVVSFRWLAANEI